MDLLGLGSLLYDYSSCDGSAKRDIERETQDYNLTMRAGRYRFYFPEDWLDLRPDWKSLRKAEARKAN